ncbi:hypothetical protein GWN63_05010, partial [Candidatus Bathyarchaeota archaeon]|nr:hypothetical protein [Desulfobacterales bacterium]NIU81586.1 hypothetical protein [Candidatus Bathyarchaeota archaeon]NIV68231.1 hypothetical protein [Candidatus Bathyarchaeota archaeon]
MRFGRRLQSGAVNSLLLLAGLYLILGGFTLANSMGLQYSPVLHSYYENQPLHLVLLSPFLDHIALLVLSALMLILPLALGLWKRALWLILLSCLLLVLRGIFYFWGAPAVGDILLVLAGFISLATILVFGADSLSLVKKTVGARILIWGCAVLLSVQFLSAFCLLLYPSFPSLAWKPSVWRFVGVETQLFHVLSGLVPILFTLTLFSWVIKPLWSYSRSWGKGGKSLAKQLGFKLSFDLGSEQAGSWNSRLSVMLLFCSLAFSLYCVLYPILLTDSMEQIGWGDLPVYARMLQDIGERGGIEAVPYIFLRFRDRAISLLLMTGVWRVTELSPYLALKSTALLLAPLLTLAAYLFARQAAHDPMVISLTPVFTAVSFHLTVGLG